ncbi:MAG: methyltransferase [Beijerinckiaceae bacterium]|nr:methyltransferase [Beijerinckiaceae bacterium]
MAESAAGLGEIGQDHILDGRLVLFQPKKGHRAGSDAVLLAATLPDLGAGPLLDMGAGVGTVGLVAALAQPELQVTLLERDPELAALGLRNAAANGLGNRVRMVAADLGAPAAVLEETGLATASFACVAMNPPFYAASEARLSPVANRRAAHVVETPLPVWLKTARRLLIPGGRLALIHRAEALPEVLAGLGVGFGGVSVRPVHASVDRPAIRILVSATLGSKKPAALLPALVLHREDGAMTEFSEALHRGTAMLRPD